jgi:hypothetical protein
MLVAGLAFIIPSVLLMLVFALYYREFVNGKFKLVDSFLWYPSSCCFNFIIYNFSIWYKVHQRYQTFYNIYYCNDCLDIRTKCCIIIVVGGFTYVLFKTRMPLKLLRFYITGATTVCFATCWQPKLLGLFLEWFYDWKHLLFVAWVKTDLVDWVYYLLMPFGFSSIGVICSRIFFSFRIYRLYPK